MGFFGGVARSTQVVVKTFTDFQAAALTKDVTIYTTAARERVVSVIMDTTTKFVGGAIATCTNQLGKTAGGVEYILLHDVFTAAITKGLADADLGASITRAAAIQGGDMPSFTATTAVQSRMISTVANLSALTQGSVTYYITTERL